jgi:GNAT superfamily N-acetyltransferase
MVREGGSEDFASATELLNRVWPHRVGSERGLRHAAAAAPPDAHRRYWAAEDARKLVGWATAAIEHQSSERPGFLQASVALESRNAGLGTALLERCEAHLAVVPEDVGSSGSPWRLRAAKRLSPKEDPDEASR